MVEDTRWGASILLVVQVDRHWVVLTGADVLLGLIFFLLRWLPRIETIIGNDQIILVISIREVGFFIEHIDFLSFFFIFILFLFSNFIWILCKNTYRLICLLDKRDLG